VGVKLPRTEKGNPSSKDEVLAGIDHPLADALSRHREIAKLVSTWGEDWTKHVGEDGRVRCDWRVNLLDTGFRTAENGQLPAGESLVRPTPPVAAGVPWRRPTGPCCCGRTSRCS
jgi:hypothetical protein